MPNTIKYLTAIIPAVAAIIVAASMAAGYSLFPASSWGDILNGAIIGILAGISLAALIHARHGPIT